MTWNEMEQELQEKYPDVMEEAKRIVQMCGNCIWQDYCFSHSKDFDTCAKNGFSSRLPITNYDKITSMNPEGLADFLYGLGCNPATGNYYLNGKLLFSCKDGNGFVEWLKQEWEA